MTETEILGVIDSFGRAAADAHALGFDGIELHAAHGYLIDQFFRAVTNDRTDRFGGDLVRRTRFAAEVVRACRRATAPDFPIILRFSQWREADYGDRLATDPAELDLFLTALAGAGVDLFHCSTRRFWLPEFDGSDLNLAGWTRKLTGLPTITVGSVGRNSDLGRLIDMMDRGDFDLVAVGRALLADPAWAEKVRHGREADLVEFQPELIDTLY